MLVQFLRSEPGFKIDAFFDLRQRAAASQKTFGLLSKITPITPIGVVTTNLKPFGRVFVSKIDLLVIFVSYVQHYSL